MSTESKSLVNLQNYLLMSDSDMAAAAQLLMQLSDEDYSSCSSNSNDDNDKKIKEREKLLSRKRVFEQSQDEITSAKIEEIFGKEEERLRPVKQQRYRLLESIYKETKPIKVSYGKNSWH